jgi:hypothetical protein
MFFHDISHLNDVDQTITADAYILLRWRDPRLADERRADGSADCPVPGDALWTPVIEADNLRSRQQYYQARFLVDAHGTITYGRRLLVQIAQPLDLRDFPFDRHVWMFTLWPVFSKVDEIVFVPLRPFVGRNDRLSLQGWNTGVPEAHASNEQRRGRLGAFARFDVTLEQQPAEDLLPDEGGPVLHRSSPPGIHRPDEGDFHGDLAAPRAESPGGARRSHRPVALSCWHAA